MEDTGALVTAAAGGDRTAWAALVERFGRLVWAVARSHQLGQADAEEVYQMTWLRLTEHIDRLKQPERVAAWLATTARNESLMVIRAGGRVTVTSDPWLLDRGSEDGSPERAVLAAEQAADDELLLERMWAAFRRLPDRCQQLLRLLVTAPRPSYAEIAELLGIPIGSIGPNRARCLDRLRTQVAG
ncbi:sigma-70 family RNA polymerase sigma factor [Dactylosporangium vinaceum]|uniref:RNA polymerase sigma factor n=1 Tax=Dactylosporangium vinaceum TaxID=53362 RepID=A0ABV5M5H3_9ACTN|nr:sigma-70 family RNA polymerase sigma factor [Dactylosporangium vinaceum]UAB95557.1 sigma-70 family RNA polymerase sigma factor [Dactylosporangium vinaceum]